MSNNLNKNKQFLRKPIKVLLITTGTFFIGVGIVGIFIPLLPTTPFLLISAALYARSSKRFYNWLINNKILGRYIKNYYHSSFMDNYRMFSYFCCRFIMGKNYFRYYCSWSNNSYYKNKAKR